MAADADELDVRLREILDKIPPDPGVYLMKDKKGKIIYVGKASSLKARVRSSISIARATRARSSRCSAGCSPTSRPSSGNEKEALLLENHLIKQHQPRFNVKLRDDKHYLVLRLDAAVFPRLEVVRNIGDDGANYFGPYHSATSCARDAARGQPPLQAAHLHRPRARNSRKRPCLQYQIKRCDAPCVFPIPEEEYGKQVQDVALFLEGKDDELTERLRGRMTRGRRRADFETAASLRDSDRARSSTRSKSSAWCRPTSSIRTCSGCIARATWSRSSVLYVRQGKLVGHRTFSFDDQEFPDDETVSSFVSLYYDLGGLVPDEVLLPLAIEDAETKADWLSEKRATAKRVEVQVPQRGSRRKLVELAQKNAASSFVTRRNKSQDVEAALGKLQSRLNLKRAPRRIECFDIAHIQGTATVASMVVFLDGEPAKAEYRTFKVKTATNDDFASMYEVLSRRFRRSKTAAANAEQKGWVVPDLLVIDGGKGQLSTALAALRDAQIDVGHERPRRGRARQGA